MKPRIERPIGLLRLVFQVDFGALEGDALGSAAAIPRGLWVHAGNEDVVHLYDEIFLLPFAGLPNRDDPILDVLTGCARFEQNRGGLVDVMGKVEVGEARLPLTAAAA